MCKKDINTCRDATILLASKTCILKVLNLRILDFILILEVIFKSLDFSIKNIKRYFVRNFIHIYLKLTINIAINEKWQKLPNLKKFSCKERNKNFRNVNRKKRYKTPQLTNKLCHCSQIDAQY